MGERTESEGVWSPTLSMLRMALLFLAVWTVFAALEVTKEWYAYNSSGRSFSFAKHIGQAAFIFYPWFLFSLGIGRLAGYHPAVMNGVRTYAIHAALAVCLGLTHLLIITSSFWIFFPGRVVNARILPVFAEQFLAWFHFEILVYVAVLLIWRSVVQHQTKSIGEDHVRRRRINGKIDGVTHVITIDLVDWFESQNNNVIAHCGSRVIKIRQTMKNIESHLDENQFIRVHRGAIVNVDRLSSMDGADLTMNNGDQVACSRRGKKTLKRILPNIEKRDVR